MATTKKNTNPFLARNDGYKSPWKKASPTKKQTYKAVEEVEYLSDDIHDFRINKVVEKDELIDIDKQMQENDSETSLEAMLNRFVAEGVDPITGIQSMPGGTQSIIIDKDNPVQDVSDLPTDPRMIPDAIADRQINQIQKNAIETEKKKQEEIAKKAAEEQAAKTNKQKTLDAMSEAEIQAYLKTRQGGNPTNE